MNIREEPWRIAFLRYWFAKSLKNPPITHDTAKEIFKAGWDAALQQVINKLEKPDE